MRLLWSLKKVPQTANAEGKGEIYLWLGFVVGFLLAAAFSLKDHDAEFIESRSNLLQRPGTKDAARVPAASDPFQP